MRFFQSAKLNDIAYNLFHIILSLNPVASFGNISSDISSRNSFELDHKMRFFQSAKLNDIAYEYVHNR